VGVNSCDFDWVFVDDAVIEMTLCSFEEKDVENEGGLLLRNAAEMVPRNNSRITTPRRDMVLRCPRSTMRTHPTESTTLAFEMIQQV